MMYVGSLGRVVNESTDDYIAESVVNESVEWMLNTGSTYLLEQMVLSITETSLEDDNKMNAVEHLKRHIDNPLNSSDVKDALEDDISNIHSDVTLGQLTDEGLMHKFRNEQAKKAYEKDKEKGIWAMVQRAANKGRDFIARVIGKLNSWIRRLYQKQMEKKGVDFGFFDRMIQIMTRAVEWLTRKAHNVIQKNRGKITDNVYAWGHKNDEDKRSLGVMY